MKVLAWLFTNCSLLKKIDLKDRKTIFWGKRKWKSLVLESNRHTIKNQAFFVHHDGLKICQKSDRHLTELFQSWTASLLNRGTPQQLGHFCYWPETCTAHQPPVLGMPGSYTLLCWLCTVKLYNNQGTEMSTAVISATAAQWVVIKSLLSPEKRLDSAISQSDHSPHERHLVTVSWEVE